MQSKGTLGSIIAGVIAIFLVLVCLFYLSFTFVGSGVESDAKLAAQQAKEQYIQSQEYAAIADQAQKNAMADAVYSTTLKAYNDSIAKEPVWLGYSYDDVKKWGIGLGLDLKGGMSVTLQVSMPDLLRSMHQAGADDINFNQALEETSTRSADYISDFVANYRKLNPAADLNNLFTIGDLGSNDNQAIARLKQEVDDRVNTSATNVIRNRVDAYGVVSPNIQVLKGKQGQILVELPGVTDEDGMTNLLTRSANLQFFTTYKENYQRIFNQFFALDKDLQNNPDFNNGIVELSYAFTNYDPETGMPIEAQKQGLVARSYSSIGNFLRQDTAQVNRMLRYGKEKGILDRDMVTFWSHKPESIDKQDYYTLYVLKSQNGEPALDGSHIRNAVADYDQMQGNIVSMEMDKEGAQMWSSITGDNINYPIAIVLDNEVYSAPNVNSRIDGGRSQISGRFDVQEAKDLANILKSGKMTSRVYVIDKMVVGPSLGQEAINSGMLSFIVALVLLMILMISYYGLIPGLVANLGLVLNLFFTLGVLASFQAVLTLSGICGIVLALGMAVDANVLIFERAKEEIRGGKNARTAIQDGYSNAFSAIFDSNLTSIITGVILLLYGTGPIKGFATTLIIGIVCSFFTAVYLTRLVFIWGAKKKAFEQLTFTTALSRKMFTSAKINFLGQRKVSGVICIAFIVLVIVSLCTRGLKPGIDFSGGRNYIVQFDKPVNNFEIEKALQGKLGDASLSVINIQGKDQVRISTNYKILDESEAVEGEIYGIIYQTLLENGFINPDMTLGDFTASNQDYGVVQMQKVGPSVADDMKRAAYVAVSLSLLAMFLYILIRFRNVAFSLGALAAVAFTAFAIVGFYSFFYGFFPFSMEIDQTFIAAILTVIGYQINDTVVVFDRVRENQGLYPKRSFGEIVNQSINATLGRTIMTSGSTLLVLLSIFILGGDAIRSFVFAMIWGVIIGTAATIYIAAPVAFLCKSRKEIKK